MTRSVRVRTIASRSVQAAIALPFVGLWFARPLAYGVTVPQALAFWAFCGLYVVLPGVLLWRLVDRGRGDLAAVLGMGTTVGLAALSVAFVLSRVLGLHALLFVYPLVPLALAWGARASTATAPDGEPPARGHALGLLLVATLGAEIGGLYRSDLIEWPMPLDLLFHVGNAAELLHHWPLEDPRVAGTALDYHFFSAILPASASQVTGVPVAPLALALVPGPMVILLVVQIYNTARALLGDALAGVVAAAIVVFHVDVGASWGLPPNAFRSYLASGVYSSPSTLLGLVYFVSLFWCFCLWLRTGALRSPREVLVLALLSFAASGSKGSVVPVVLLGLLTLAVVRWVGRRSPSPVLRSLVVAGLAAAPMTALLVLGGGSYAGMLRLEPGSLLHASPFYQEACARLTGLSSASLPSACSGLPWYYEIPVALVWLGGYLALGGVGTLLWLLHRRGTLDDAVAFGLGVVGWGLALAYCLNTSSGLSQLFFLYNGQILLAIGGAAFLVGAFRGPRRPAALASAMLLAALFALPMARHGVLAAVDSLDTDARLSTAEPRPVAREYVAGLDWLRSHSPSDAVVVTRHGALVVSPFAERRCYYETGFFSPRGHRLRWKGIGEPYPERIALRTRLADGDDDALPGIETAVGPGVDVFLLQDDVSVAPGFTGWLSVRIGEVTGVPPPRVGALLFQNAALRIYRMPPESAP
jgi:hypothetical protein